MEKQDSETTIRLRKETRKKLTRLKDELDNKNLDETINYLFFELEKEGKFEW